MNQNLTPEEIDAAIAWKKRNASKKYNDLTPEEIDAAIAYKRKNMQQKPILGTPEEFNREAAGIRNYMPFASQETVQNAQAAGIGAKEGAGKYPLGIAQLFAPEWAENKANRWENELQKARAVNPNAVSQGQYLGDLAITGPAFAATGGGSATGGLLSRIGSEALKAGLTAGALGGLEYVHPGQKRGHNAIENALMGGAIGAGLPLAGRTAKGLYTGIKEIPNIPEHFAAQFGKNIPIEQLEKNVAAAEGTNTSLGNIIESPYLRKLHENRIPNVPFGPGDEGLQKIAKQVEQRGQSILSKLGEGLPAGKDPNKALRVALEDAYMAQETKKKALYAPVNEQAKKEGFKVYLDTFYDKARAIANGLNNSILKNDPQLRHLFNKVIGIGKSEKQFKNANGGINQSLKQVQEQINKAQLERDPITGAYTKPRIKVQQALRPSASLFESDVLASSLSREAKRYKRSPDPTQNALGEQIEQLAQALRHDTNHSLEQTGSKELKNLRNSAKSNYAENFSGWLDERKFLHPDVSSQTLAHEIVGGSGKLDKFERLEKIQGLLPKHERNLIPYAFLEGARDLQGNLNASMLRNRINSLGRRQFEAMFPDEGLRKQFMDFTNLAKKNEHALTLMHNPRTGYQALKDLSGILGTSTGYAFGGAPGAAAAIGLRAGVAHQLNKFLESPEFRKKVAERIKQNRAKTFAKGTKVEDAVSSPIEESLIKAMVYSGAADREKRKK